MDYHIPVLVDEVLSFVPDQGVMVDGTVGDGGHAGIILAERPHISYIGIDRDPVSVKRATERLHGESRFRAVVGSYADLLELVPTKELSFVLLDLGFSSAQLADGERGLSFQQDGPLDMRYDQSDVRLPSAAEIVNRENPVELARILWEYGEETQSVKIAHALIAARPIHTTGELVAAIAKVIPTRPGQKISPATKTFQALRIAVNREFDELDHFLAKVVPALPTGCRVGVISFHSLEDRRVKRAFRALTKPSRNDLGELPAPQAKALTKKPLIASFQERTINPRSRSAKLRVIELI